MFLHTYNMYSLNFREASDYLKCKHRIPKVQFFGATAFECQAKVVTTTHVSYLEATV